MWVCVCACACVCVCVCVRVYVCPIGLRVGWLVESLSLLPAGGAFLGPVHMKTFSGENGTVSSRLYLPFTCIRNKSSRYMKMFQVVDMFEIVLKTILCKHKYGA